MLLHHHSAISFYTKLETSDPNYVRINLLVIDINEEIKKDLKSGV